MRFCFMFHLLFTYTRLLNKLFIIFDLNEVLLHAIHKKIFTKQETIKRTKHYYKVKDLFYTPRVQRISQ